MALAVTKSFCKHKFLATFYSAVKKYPCQGLTSYRFFCSSQRKLNVIPSPEQKAVDVTVPVKPKVKKTKKAKDGSKEKVLEPEAPPTVCGLENPWKDVLDYEDYFQVQNLVTLKELFEARVHMGHKTGCRNPYMKSYLFGNRLDVDIIDLDETLKHMKIALNFVAHIAYRGGIILFVSRHQQCMPLIEETAREVHEYAHCRYWKGGCFTNSATQYGFVTRLPDLCIFVTTLNAVFEQHLGIIDSAKMLIPTVGIVDSNCDPRLISYPIPGNDDTPSCIELYCNLFKAAIIRGKYLRKINGLAADTEQMPSSMFSY